MRIRKMLIGALIVIAGLLLLSAPCVLAQDVCEGNFNCDQDVDGSDAALFKSDFGRSEFFNPCPPYDIPFPCNPCPYGMVDCGAKCVDPMADEDFCGVDSACLGGTICGANERCVTGICEIIEEVIYQAAVPKTGQTTSYATGDDGDLEKGVAWPNPRFTDNHDGTVTDNLTGLIWLKNADCFGTRTWNNALSDCNGLSNGDCGLTDSSIAGDWRLPQLRELISLIDASNYAPALPLGHPFTNVYADVGVSYWTSTTFAGDTDNAWYVIMGKGVVARTLHSNLLYVWPVRGGQ